MGSGQFTAYNMNGFRLHAYCSNDPLGDTSYIVESENGLVLLEYPLFKENIYEFQQYLERLHKTVCASIQDYHLNGYTGAPIIMAEGMPQFMAGPVYSGMMESFAKTFGDAITPVQVDETAIQIPFGQTAILADVPFKFEHGASTDFPAASLLIGKQVYYTHWTPSQAHMSPLQLNNREAVTAELHAAVKEKSSGATLFIGGHGGVAAPGALQFRIEYLETIQKALEEHADKHGFILAIKKAYPSLQEEQHLESIATNLYD